MFQSRDEKYHHLRSATRYNTDGFKCHDGALADLSGTGMRICFEGKPGFKVGETKDFRITASGQAVKLSGIVVWLKRSSLFGKEYQAGIHFSNLRPELQKAIQDFAIHGVLMTKAPGNGFSGSPKKSARVSFDGPDHYTVLGLPRSASDQQIHEAYRQLAKRLHPDMNRELDAADRFKQVTEAYRILKDSNLRTQYDLSQTAA